MYNMQRQYKHYKKHYSKEEEDFLRAHYNNLTSKELMVALQRSWQAIHYKIWTMGLHRSRKLHVAIAVKHAKPLKLKQFALGYLVGLIEGEGTIGTSKSCVRVSISNTNKELLENAKGMFGSGFIVYEGHYGRDNTKMCYRLEVKNILSAYRILNAIRPYVIVKRRVLNAALEYINLWVKKQFGEDVKEETFTTLRSMIKQINQRGLNNSACKR